jgi:hypothetical protein
MTRRVRWRRKNEGDFGLEERTTPRLKPDPSFLRRGAFSALPVTTLIILQGKNAKIEI